jgi:SAM-dependent methyltransferase
VDTGCFANSHSISNAALHWILRDESTRLSTLRAIYNCLKPGGTFVFEAGGHSNVGEVLGALIWALVHHGVSLDEARAAVPWFFASDAWMKNALESLGFRVERIELEYRPTRLTSSEGGGLAGWIRLMGAQMLDALPDQGMREEVVKEVCDVLQTVVTREEDGSQWLGYVRLRGIARRA